MSEITKEQVMSLKSGDIITLRGRVFKVKEDPDNKIYLTEQFKGQADLEEEYHTCRSIEYHEAFHHVYIGVNNRRAIMTHDELWNIIENDSFHIH